ncbi:MAG: potassium transporter TrkA [Anaerolineaceae bacterium]|nr:potassium transporter TrkA [Anaerolineaceae bacterium]
MQKITFQSRARYWFDNLVARGPAALIAGLFLLSLTLILLVSLVVAVSGIAPQDGGGANPSFIQIAWMSLMRTLDAGTMGGDSGSWYYLLAMFIVTLGGVFIVSTLIGVLTSGIDGKLEEIRKGRSLVVEQGHTVILGWAPQIFTILSELILANANRRRAVVAILAEKDKVEMEDEIRAHLPHTGSTRIVCRTGSPVEIADLEIVNPQASRAIIILPAEESETPDSNTIKTILALTNAPDRRLDRYHIVAALHNPKNFEVARMVGKDEVELVLVGRLIARVTAQTCRQSGLSVVYTKLLDFDGDEIYFQEEAALTGSTFGEALMRYEDSAVIGLEKDGRVLLNPPMDMPIAAGDRVIAVSADDDTIRLSGIAHNAIDESAIRSADCASPEPVPERTLMLGWNRRAPLIIREMENYTPRGSEVTIVAETQAFEQPGFLKRVHLDGMKHQTLRLQYGDTTDRQTLDTLDTHAYDRIIVLSYSDNLARQEADARTLITLLHLRDMAEKSDSDFTIISEMLDVRNRDLAESTRADDFIISDRLISLMLTQISENKQLGAVFADLFDAEGCELYIKPAAMFVETGKALNFYTVVEAARRCGAVAIGYRIHAEAHDAAAEYGIHINPRKSQMVTFVPEDRIIVLAEK